MRLLPEAYYQIMLTCATKLGLPLTKMGTFALWVYGCLLADCASEAGVVDALSRYAIANSIRQRLRYFLKAEWSAQLYFARLLGWFLDWAKPETLVLAFDASLVRDRYCLLCISVIYRATAIPLAWQVLPANHKGKWLPPLRQLFGQLSNAVPLHLPVLVLTDRGLHSRKLWQLITSYHWHPLFRQHNNIMFRPNGGQMVVAKSLVAKPGMVEVSRGLAYGGKARAKMRATCIVMWSRAEQEHLILLTDLPPTLVKGSWYRLRSHIEQGFRELKSYGWQFQHSRRRDMLRIQRHLLVVAVAQLYTLALGTREEEQPQQLGRAPRPARVRCRGGYAASSSRVGGCSTGSSSKGAG